MTVEEIEAVDAHVQSALSRLNRVLPEFTERELVDFVMSRRPEHKPGKYALGNGYKNVMISCIRHDLLNYDEVLTSFPLEYRNKVRKPLKEEATRIVLENYPILRPS